MLGGVGELHRERDADSGTDDDRLAPAAPLPDEPAADAPSAARGTELDAEAVLGSPEALAPGETLTGESPVVPAAPEIEDEGLDSDEESEDPFAD